MKTYSLFIENFTWEHLESAVLHCEESKYLSYEESINLLHVRIRLSLIIFRVANNFSSLQVQISYCYLNKN
jgi:hypothetical protein